MGTMNQFEERIRPYKLALVEAFELSADQTGSQISADRKGVTFLVVARDAADFNALRAGPLKLADIRYESGQYPAATFPASGWTEEQSAAVEAYVGQFPSFEDFPRDVRAQLRERFDVERP